MPFINRFHYQLDGEKGLPVVVLSNSLGTTLDMWAAQVELFSQHFQVLRYDTRGHGESIVSPGPYQFEQLARDVVNLLDGLGIEKAHFCGISMGGQTGQWLGIHAGHRFNKLVLCNTAAKIGTPEGWNDRARLVSGQGMGPVADTTISRWFTADFAEQNPAKVNPLINLLRQTSPAGYAACCQALAQADFRDTISQISNPTLLVAGLHDPVTTPADADFMAARIAGSQRADVSASHISNVEATDAFNQAVLDFLLN